MQKTTFKTALSLFVTVVATFYSFSAQTAQLACRSDEILIAYQNDGQVYAVSTSTADSRRAVTPYLGASEVNALAMDTDNGILYYVYEIAGDSNRAIRYYDFANNTQGVLIADVNTAGISTTVGVSGGAASYDSANDVLYFGVESATTDFDIIYKIPVTYTGGVPSAGAVSTFTSFDSSYDWGDIVVDSSYVYENYYAYNSSTGSYSFFLSAYNKSTGALITFEELPSNIYNQIGIDNDGQLYRLSGSSVIPVTFDGSNFSYSGSSVTQNFGGITDGASCTPAPLLDKAFSNTTILDGETTTLTFTLTNIGNNPEQTNISFTDTLPASLEVAATPNIGGTCPNVATAVTATAGSSSIAVNSIGIPANTASCTITVDVSNTAESINNDCSTNPTAFTNTKSNISSSDNVSPDFVTSACLEVTASSDVSVTKTDGSGTYTPGGTDTYIITVENSGPTGVSSVVVSDDLPTGVTLSGVWSCTVTTAGSGNVTTACPSATGGSIGATSVNLNVDLANGGVITISVPVQYPATP